MIYYLGWYCFGIGVLQSVALWYTAYGIDKRPASYRLSRTLHWIANPIWFIAAVECWR